MAALPLGRLLADRTAAGCDEDGLPAGGAQRMSTPGKQPSFVHSADMQLQGSAMRTAWRRAQRTRHAR